MENVSKALIMAASVLIGIVLLSMLIFIFKRFGDTARSTDKRLSQREINSFNAKFVSYETGGNHNETDQFGVTQVGEYGFASETTNFSYEDVFKKNSVFTTGSKKKFYNRALITASQNLNKVSDVVSAINDAIDINDRNNNGYLYDGLEVQNSVEIIVDLGSKKFNFNKQIGTTNSYYQYLMIEPNEFVRAKNVYGFTSVSNDKIENVNKFNETVNKDANNIVKVYDMLEELRDTKIIEENNKKYTVYKYYFFGEVVFNKITNLVETVKFTLVEDKKF